MNWSAVPALWQAAFELAWQSHLAGSNPIGALVADSEGRIIATGKSAVRAEMDDVAVFHNEIAHAEVNALLQLDNRIHGKAVAKDYTLYSTMEPCPLCLSALYMSDVETLCYASKDAYAGSTNLLGSTPYFSRKLRKISGPEPALAEFSIFLYVYHDLAVGGREDDPVLVAYQSDYPEAVALGRRAAADAPLMAESAAEAFACFEKLQLG